MGLRPRRRLADPRRYRARDNRQERTAVFIRETAADPLRALFFAPDRREPFAALHALADDGF